MAIIFHKIFSYVKNNSKKKKIEMGIIIIKFSIKHQKKRKSKMEFIIDESVPVEIIVAPSVAPIEGQIEKLAPYYPAILAVKLETASIDVLVKILKEFRCRITNIKNPRVPLEKRKDIAINAIMSSNGLNDNKETAKRLLETYFVKKN